MARARTSARSDGTAFPICRCADVRSPAMVTSSGNVWSRHSSRVLRRRLVQWNGPTAGPGCAWIVHDGRSFASLRRKFQYRVRQPKSGSPSPRGVWWR